MAIYQARDLRNNDFRQNMDGLIITKSSYHPRFNLNWHSHHNPSLLLILKGGNNDQRKKDEKSLLLGDLVVYRSGELHKCTNYSTESRHFLIEFEERWFKKYSIPYDIQAKSFLPKDPDIKTNIIRLLNEFTYSSPAKQLSVDSMVLDCIATLSNCRISKHAPRWINSLKDLLHDEYNNTDLSLKYLSEKMGVHPVTISKYFTRYCKITLGDYIRKIKISKSLSLLSKKSIPIEIISIDLGFADHAHFSRSFKRYTTMTPSQYRQFVHG